jgi:hypothetical protein
MEWGLTAGLIGGFIGVLGGVVGTYFGIKNTKTSRERALIIKTSVICWVFVLGFVTALLLLPSPWKFLLWVAYGPLLMWGIQKANREQARIRSEEETRINWN